MKNAYSLKLKVLALVVACAAPLALVAADDTTTDSGTTPRQRPAARAGRGGPPGGPGEVRGRGGPGVLPPERLAALNLTEEQKAAIAAIRTEARETRKESADEIRAVLTPEQLAALDAKPAGRGEGRAGPPGRGGRGGPGGPGRARGGPPPSA